MKKNIQYVRLCFLIVLVLGISTGIYMYLGENNLLYSAFLKCESVAIVYPIIALWALWKLEKEVKPLSDQVDQIKSQEM